MGQFCESVEQLLAVATITGSFDTVRVTGMVCGPFTAPVPVTEIELLYVPGARPAGFTETAKLVPVVPLVGALSHGAPLASAMTSGSWPLVASGAALVVVIFTFCAAGTFAPNW